MLWPASILSFVAVLAGDLVTKALVTRELGGGRVVELPLGVRFEPGENRSVAFGLPAGGGIALSYGLRQAAGALGVALFGSLLTQTYAAQINASGLLAPAADVARDSIAGALAVAARLDAPALLASAKAAYVDGLALVLIVCAAIAVLGAALIAAFMPGLAARADEIEVSRDRELAA